MKKVRILHVIEGLSLGGAERRLINDLKLINKQRFECAVSVLFNQFTLEEEISKAGISIYKLNFKSFADLAGFRRLLKLIKIFKPDIIHTQLFWADIFGRIAGKISGIPSVTTIQSSVYEPESGCLFSRKRKLLDYITGRIVNGKYIAVSESVKESIIKRLGIKKGNVRVIYNYVDSSCYDKTDLKTENNLKNELGLTSGDIVLSTVGRLNPPKGHNFLFEALSVLKPEFPSLKLLVVGDGPSRKELSVYARSLGIEKKVIFLGLRQDAKELIAVSDIFVFPTLSEGMPVSLLEAMTLQKLCVASSIGPIREVIEDKKTGYLFSPGNSQELASVLRSILKSGDGMNEIAMRGARFVSEKFNATKAVNELSSFYEEVYAENRK